jgi:hypothetical protein
MQMQTEIFVNSICRWKRRRHNFKMACGSWSGNVPEVVLVIKSLSGIADD